METLYFTLGIASVVVTAVAVVAVWAMFKVAKLNATLRNVEQQFASTHRDITMVEQTIMNNIDHLSRDMDSRIETLYQDLDRRFEESIRHTDSRVDKLAAKQEKQLIKG